MHSIRIFSGSSVRELSSSIADHLHTKIQNASISSFRDGETSVSIEESVRGKDIFLIQSLCFPVNDNLMELVMMVDALRRAAANRITVIIPYLGYSRQDRRHSFARAPIAAKVVAGIISRAGIHHVVTIDLHSEQIQGFFDVPIDDIHCHSIFSKDISRKNIRNFIVVSPDLGGIKRTQNFSKMLNKSKIAIINKERIRNRSMQMVHLIGNVSGKDCVLVDDILDTGKTLCCSAEFLKQNGANRILVYVTHPIFSRDSSRRIERSCIDRITVSDSVPLNPNVRRISKVNVLSLSKILANVIRRLDGNESISSVFRLPHRTTP